MSPEKIPLTKENKHLTVCFTGHRVQKLAALYSRCGFQGGNDGLCMQTLRKTIYTEIEKLIKNGANHFISGMALGVDIFAAQAVLSLKEKFPDIIAEAAVPCLGQEDKWRKADKIIYGEILEKCDIKTFISREYDKTCMHRRNRYMVDNSDCVLAVWDGSDSGTGNTVKYALKSGKAVHCIDPLTFKVCILGEISEGEITFFNL